MATEPPPPTKLELKLLVDQNSHRVLFAEAGKDFADFLLGLLRLPLGHVTRLVGHRIHSNSIASLYSSLESFPDDYLIAPAVGRANLLDPTALSYTALLLLGNSVDKKVKILYHCSGYADHLYLSEVAGPPCPECQRNMNWERNVLQTKEEMAREQAGGGYVKMVVRYMVTDDLAVVPMPTLSTIDLLNKFHVKDVSSLFVSLVEVGMQERLELLKASLRSKTVLTDVFLPKFKGGVSIDWMPGWN